MCKMYPYSQQISKIIDNRNQNDLIFIDSF